MPAAAEAAAGRKPGGPQAPRAGNLLGILEKRVNVRNKILVFGDSITYGQRDLELGGWVNRLRLALANDSSIPGCHVFNMGISGQTTGEVLERLDRECRGRVLEGFRNIIILAAGINDTQILNGEILVGEDEFRGNVRGLIAQAKSNADRVIYVGLTPVKESATNPWDRVSSWRNCRIERYDAIIQEVCAEEDVRYIRMYDLIDPETNKDGLHPSEESHELMACVMKSVLDDYLKGRKR